MFCEKSEIKFAHFHPVWSTAKIEEVATVMRCAVRKIRSQKTNSRFDGARVSGQLADFWLPICNLIMGYLFLASIYLLEDVWRFSTIIDLLSYCIFPITNKKDGYAYVDAAHLIFVKYEKQFDLYFMNTFLRR